MSIDLSLNQFIGSMCNKTYLRPKHDYLCSSLILGGVPQQSKFINEEANHFIVI